MDIKDLKELSLKQTLMTLVLLFIFSMPPIIFIIIYDFNLFWGADIWKILLATLAVSASLFAFNFMSLFIVSVSFEKFSPDNEGGLLMLDMVAVSIIYAAVILNLIRLKFYLETPNKELLKASVSTLLLTQGIILALQMIVFFYNMITGIKKLNNTNTNNR